jgi:transcriptional regulator of arginine metabolism
MQGRHAAMSAGSATASASSAGSSSRGATATVLPPPSKRDRQRLILELVGGEAIGSQQDLVDRLNARGHAVTQATVSRDIAELGLVKAPSAAGHVYVTPASLGGGAAAGTANGTVAAPPASDERLRRILSDIPVTIGRSGLILLLTGTPGTANVIAQAIDESSVLTGQEGTLAGDNTLLVLFADEPRLLAWRDRFDAILASAQEARIP